MAEPTFSITTTVRTYPHLPYEEIKNDILGKRYTLSLVFIGTKRARSLNEQYRGKEYVPNVLSFPLDERHGEIFITPAVAKRECVKWSMTPREYIGYLFIHGLLHLKGYHHGATMDKAEKRYCKRHDLA